MQISADLPRHVSSSTLTTHQMARAGEFVDSDEWVLMRPRDIGKSFWASRSSGSGSCRKVEVYGTGTGSLVPVRIHSLRCLLGDGLRGEGLGIPSPLLGCHQVRGAPVMDVPVIIQLKFLQYYENVEVPQIPFLGRVLQLQLCFRGVYAQCKLCKSWRFHRAVLRRCLRAHCCALTGAGDGPDSAENREISARVLGLGSMPVVVQRQVPDGRDSAENCGVSAVGAALGQGC